MKPLQYELVAFELEKLLFANVTSIDKWNDYWDMLEACGWQYMDFMNEMEKRVSQEWTSICTPEKNQCSN